MNSTSDTTRMRLAAKEVVREQERVCQERYASDKDMTKLQAQVAVQWGLLILTVGSVLALAWKILGGGVMP